MTTYVNDKVRPEIGRYYGYDHLTFWYRLANILGLEMPSRRLRTMYRDVMGRFYVVGFEPVGYKGLENGNRQVVSHAVRQAGIVFVFKSPLTTNDRTYGNHLILHGDAVKDVAFSVDDARGIYNVC